MNILLTGAKGLLGQALVHALAECGTVTPHDIDTMDITDPIQVKSVFETSRPDVVVHAAALKGNKPSRENPVEFYRVNTAGTLHLLEACRLFQTTRFVFVSSLTVHGMHETEVTEEFPMYPIHPYGASKAAAEACVQAYTRSYGFTAAIVRPNFIVGPIDAPVPYLDNILYDFLQAVDRSGTITVAGDGSFERDWVHPHDVALAVQRCVVAPLSGCEAFIVAANRIRMKDLAQRLIAAYGQGRVETDSTMGGFTLVASSRKAREQLGWVAQKTIDVIIQEIIDEYRQRASGVYYGHEPRYR